MGQVHIIYYTYEYVKLIYKTGGYNDKKQYKWNVYKFSYKFGGSIEMKANLPEKNFFDSFYIWFNKEKVYILLILLVHQD